jgi:hypothetical protein
MLRDAVTTPRKRTAKHRPCRYVHHWGVRVCKGKADVTVCSQALHHTKEAIDAFEKGLSIDGDNAALHAGIMQAIADACAWDKKERYLPKVLSSMQREVQAALQHGAPRLPHPSHPRLPPHSTCRVSLSGSFSIALVGRRRVWPFTVRLRSWSHRRRRTLLKPRRVATNSGGGRTPASGGAVRRYPGCAHTTAVGTTTCRGVHRRGQGGSEACRHER